MNRLQNMLDELEADLRLAEANYQWDHVDQETIDAAEVVIAGLEEEIFKVLQGVTHGH